MKYATFATALLLSFAAQAHEFKVADIRIGHPYARTTVPGQPAGGAYLSLENNGKSGDKLVGASSPAAKTVEVHTMSMEGNVMKMREVGSIDLPAGAKVAMKPGDGYHLMLMGLQAPLKAGDKIPMTLVFEKAGKVEVTVNVEEPKKASAEASASHQH